LSNLTKAVKYTDISFRELEKQCLKIDRSKLLNNFTN
jgi:hypothetical protein